MDKAMVYAPVIIPTLCRDKHFIRCMESLRRNPWAKYTEVYVGLDYPAKEEHWAGYKVIDEYLNGSFPEFREVHVFRREKNVGAAGNSNMLRAEVYKKFDRYIYLEDDLEASPNFLEYIDKSLKEYEDNPDVIAVSGYAYPLEWKIKENCTVVKQNFNGSIWGSGFWHSKRIDVWEHIRSNQLAKDFPSAYRTGRLNAMTDFAVMDYVNLCQDGWSGINGYLNNLYDLTFRIYLGVYNKYFIMPSISKIRNHGYDGSGLCCPRINGNAEGDYCVENYLFSAQPIDESDRFYLKEDKQFDLDANRELLNRFDRVSSETMNAIRRKAKKIARRGKYGGALIAGKKVIRKTWQKITKQKH